MNTRALLIAEAANPEWVSVPLVGWSLSSAIARLADAHLVTQVRNRDAIRRAGLEEGRDFTAIDSEAIAGPLYRLASRLRGGTGLGWTTDTALAALGYYYFEWLVWKRFGAAIGRGEYDVVHRVTPLSPTVPSLLAARCRGAGVPFVVGPVNGGLAWPAAFAAERRQEREWLSYARSAHRLLPGHRSMLASARALIAGSRDTLRRIPSRFHHKCVYLPENAVDPARFSLAARPADRVLRACFVGRLVPYKGPDLALEALAPLLACGRIRFDIIGDGPLMGALRERVARLGLEDSVTLHGWVEHAALQGLMRESQLFVFPSIREFGGGAVLEAMALGVVPVVVDYGGPGELVSADTGFKVALGSRREIAARLLAAVDLICEDPRPLARMAQAARERALSLFTWSSKAAQVMQVYDWVLGRRPQKPAFFESAA